jgi:hypothetical protein
MMEPGPTLENGCEGTSLDAGIYSFLKAATLMTLRDASQSTSTWYSLMLAMVGETSSGSCPAPAKFLGQLEALKLIDISIHLWWGAALGADTAAATARCRVLMTRRDNVPGDPIYHMEHLAMLLGVGLRVGEPIDRLQRPLGILVLHLLILVVLQVHFLLALLLLGRRTVLARLLLLLLVDLLRKLLDLSALLSTVTPGVVHQAPQATLVTIGELSRSLVTVWASTPTYCCSCSGASIGQRLVLAADLLLLLFAPASGSNIYVRLADFPYL